MSNPYGSPRPDYDAMLATPVKAQDGRSWLTGYRIPGGHCMGCMRPTSRVQGWRAEYEGRAPMSASSCCLATWCGGYVCVTPFTDRHDETVPAVYACCSRMADTHLGEGRAIAKTIHLRT